ncbi:zinc ribbon domain-containing protein [Haloplanus sp. GCM10025708]|uniref:double zinc ribbon domain-containing protein n=1 Tax=Haloplanus sp. GCM10025708 TaxID=3252679 RepID=UPI003611F164
MSKITFRADDDLVERLEAFDASKSEVMREALRSYLDDAEEGTADSSVDDALASRVDALIAERLDAVGGRASPAAPDINVNVTLDGATSDSPDASVERETADTPRKTRAENAGETSNASRKTCGQCGENLDGEHVYCPNCGEKTSHRVFCECGDEIRSGWAFCPSCGRRTPAADVLDRP